VSELVKMFWRSEKTFALLVINSPFLSCAACSLVTILSMLYHYTDIMYICSSYLTLVVTGSITLATLQFSKAYTPYSTLGRVVGWNQSILKVRISYSCSF
jgi:hypothetical protein